MLYPMFMLVILTYVVLLLTARTRIGSVRDGSVPIDYYALMSGHEVPDFVAKTTRHFNNLFEVPVLFYAGAITYLALDLSTSIPVTLAWCFVGARFVHTMIHLGYNNVLHRLIVFGIGNVFVLAMWISIVMVVRSTQ